VTVTFGVTLGVTPASRRRRGARILAAMAARVRFDKYEGLGNDFIVVDAGDEGALPPAAVSALCDRNFGVGADGVLLVLPARTPGCAARMRVVNADGSIPEMCGNGLRCVALHLARRARSGASREHAGDVELRVETDAGERTCRLDGSDRQAMVTVDMGPVRVLGDRAVAVDGRSIVVALADAGNPHAVLFGDYTRADAERLGPRIATHADFPRGTNVEFARAGADGIDVVVWERGVGITLACGTGACATAAVACEKGLVARGRPVTVRLLGGPLEVTIDDSGRATMRGPARHVFSGETSAK
jgi:diaminopimelate epimerase